jgi:hypothetical protein
MKNCLSVKILFKIKFILKNFECENLDFFYHYKFVTENNFTLRNEDSEIFFDWTILTLKFFCL